ncbi:MAG: 2-amino-4-hydroxy-6-hydroxymethyldihydropteridine diphosphokinase [Verrucomicrobiota bacterium]|nr:2-amino-4-hydroxy-6-hydroxymethyldihydropteridine diphosphokinase [Verrucomicrobiota bacterium]
MGVEHKMVYVALGSNLGESVVTLRLAAAKISDWSVDKVVGSSLWETEPLDCQPDSPLFINAVIGLNPKQGITPESLLDQLLELELQLGRERSGLVNEPRKIDLDLIAFGMERRNTESLILPHPRAFERQFVLSPLEEIAPDFILPGQEKSVSGLLKILPSEGVLRLDQLLLV